ncbi:6,7-dimethyl-8-ribityllumazine synthase [Methylobacterium iners]|uniref:6,7-dimethyl-8-ribityllumazine synthase n=1 Tax=Methylobacterium iners TaxID=418707 RepID=A0ABQ4RQ10_9HYPH|nr:6,7-dimethyl-8-ribityllumazine synthase [Methylobacterium iners]GJD92840.1 6,7-dimethyl-8-ribityllumazine synthase 1 [Methylobacterium iners]
MSGRSTTSHTTNYAALRGARVLVVEARYYDTIADELLAGARAVLDRVGAEATIVTVPGALEIPTAIAILVETAARAGQSYDAALALGCVIRGETGHYDIVAGESARALMDLSIALRLPLGNGILTVETEAQALARARTTEGDKGGGAVEAALTVLALKRAASAAPVGED